MIVLHNKSLLIFTPPKTGSTSLHEALTKMDGGRWLISDTQWQHVTYTPKPYRKFTKVLLVRNPYERFQSIWGHHQRNRMADKLDYGTIQELAERVVAGDYPGADWFFGNITDHYGDCGYELYWQIEHIQDCISKRGLSVWVPHINRNTFAKQALSQEVVKILRPWAEPDCERFGYQIRG